MPSTPRSLLLVVGAAAAVLVGVTACTATGQSKAEACGTALASIDAATSHLNTGLSNLSTDASGAAKSLQQGEETLSAGLKSITNPEVKSAGDGAAKSVSALTALATGAAADPGTVDSSKLAAASRAVSEDFVGVRKLCG